MSIESSDDERGDAPQYTGIWPFRKLKKKPLEDVLQEILNNAMADVYDTLTDIQKGMEKFEKQMDEVREIIDDKLSDAKFSEHSLTEVKARFVFLENMINKLIDVAHTPIMMPEPSYESKYAPANDTTWEEKQRQLRLKEKLLSKRNGDSNSGGFGAIDSKAKR